MADILSGDYPQSWDEYVGQKGAKRALQVASASAAKRGVNLAHTLICSPIPGSGKTALALQTIRELGARVHMVAGSMTIHDVRMMFTKVEDGDVIFYDEFHKVMDGGKKNAEWLLHYLENGVLLTKFGEEKVPKVTIIGTTTDKGVIAEPILQRLTVVELEPYTDDEAARIAQGLSEKILEVDSLPGISQEIAAAIATAASNQPRMMRKILQSVRDLATVNEIEAPLMGGYDLTEALELCGVTRDGLDTDCQRYLTIMYGEMRGEPAGAAQLKERLGLVGNGLPRIEALLLDKGLIIKTKQGRILSATGMRRAMELIAIEEEKAA